MLLSKVTLLDGMFSKAGIGVVGVQEGRSHFAGKRTGDNYDMYISAATKQGQYGSQVWISRKLGFRLQSDRAAHPRLMSVVGILKSDIRRYQFVSALAPTEASSADEKSEFHDLLTSLLQEAKTKCPNIIQFVKIDGNARVGSVKAECFGDANAENESQNGMMLRDTLLASKLIAVNTFKCPGYTWRSPKQTTARIDYICCQLRPEISCLDTYIEHDIDISLGASEDHRVLAASFKIANRSAPESSSDKTVGFNKLNLVDPSCVKSFQDDVWQFRACAGESIDAHAARLDAHVARAALWAFGKATDRPAKQWISRSTWQVVNWIAPLRRLSLKAFYAATICLCRVVFLAWASAVSRTYVPGTCVPALGWGAMARADSTPNCVRFLWTVNALGWHTCSLLQRIAKSFVHDDRK